MTFIPEDVSDEIKNVIIYGVGYDRRKEEDIPDEYFDGEGSVYQLDKNGNRVYPAEENCEVEAMPSELPSNVFRLKTVRGSKEL
jgi:hypothetical protein